MMRVMTEIAAARAPRSRTADADGARPSRSLYVHVPFCAHKCEYCAFYSHTPDGDVLQRYADALVREMELVAAACRPDTIFFGGGTPSILGVRQWETILGAMRRLGLGPGDEWTIECNPATVTPEKLALWRDAGVNRASMGVQSMDVGLLERLGRVHSRDQVFRAFERLRAAGFSNVNLDLMFALPGQTMEQWRATISEILALGPEHLSSYEVIYEEDTPLFEQMSAGEIDVDEDLACAMYDELVDRAGEAGFHQYEVANFGRGPMAGDEPSFGCRHNMGYWRGEPGHGLGPSASEFVGGVRSKNFANTELWISQLAKGRRGKENAEALGPLAAAGERAAFGLRMTSGWRFEEFQRRTGFDLRREWAEDMDALVACGWGEPSTERFRLTRQGLRFADAAGEMLLRPE
jgi:oxygen-independent coproporphyrinogen III oxidase